MSANITLQLLKNISDNGIIKTYEARSSLPSAKINVSSIKGQAFLPSDSKKVKKKKNYTVKKKYLKKAMYHVFEYWNRQYAFQCLCLTDSFLPSWVFFFYSVKQEEKKITHPIIALVVVILSRFKIVTRVVW